jgi:hypothetical protein
MSTFAWVIGLAAAVCTTAANLPQLKKAWTTGQTDDISLKNAPAGSGNETSLRRRLVGRIGCSVSARQAHERNYDHTLCD